MTPARLSPEREAEMVRWLAEQTDSPYGARARAMALDLKAELDAVRASEQTMREALEAVEWKGEPSESQGLPRCPSCGMVNEYDRGRGNGPRGHGRNCPVGIALRLLGQAEAT